MKAHFQFFVISVLLSILSCQSPNSEKQITGKNQGSAIELEYARNFKMVRYADYLKLQVCNPWVGNADTLIYYLKTSNTENPKEFSDGDLIDLSKVNRIICLSTTHVGFLSALNVEDLITGVSGSKWINNPKLQAQLESGHTREVGMNSNYNYETLIDLQAEVVFAFGINEQSRSEIQKLKDLGIPVVLVAEFMEQHPLGKAEWIKFFGAIANKQEQADLHFKQVKAAYLALKEKCANIKQKPTVFTGLPWKGDWYVPGGRSFQAMLFRDAGGLYLWNDNENVSGMVVDIETVIDRAIEADYWLNLNDYRNRAEVLSLDERYDDFKAFKQGNMFNNNARKNQNNGNDYWETGAVRPDIVLHDLVGIFHPDIVNRDSLHYYQQLN